MFPLNKTLIGYHYYPDMDHYTQRDLETWIPILHSLGAEMVVLHGSPDIAIPEAFLTALVHEGIRPVIHIPVTLSSLTLDSVDPLLSTYSRWGITEVILGDRPNMRASWDPAEWSRTHLIQRYVDRILPLLEAEFRHGLTPILPPLEPGGDYWDTAFLEDSLRSMVERAEPTLLQELNLGIYAWTFGKSLEYGSGGNERWPDSQPYHTPEGSENQMGFGIPDWYRQITQSTLGHSCPMIACRGGARYSSFEGDNADGQHAAQNAGIFRLLQGEGLCSLSMLAFDHLVSSTGSVSHADAWFQEQGIERDVVQEIRTLAAQQITQEPKAIQQAIPTRHIVFFPDESDDMRATLLAEAAPFLAVEKPCIVFDIDAVQNCQRITILSAQPATGSIQEKVHRSNVEVSWFDRSTIPALNAAAQASIVEKQVQQ